VLLLIQGHGPQELAFALDRQMAGRPAGILGHAAGLLRGQQEFVAQEWVVIAGEGIPRVRGDVGDGLVDG
jgi:hypothetical protein